MSILSGYKKEKLTRSDGNGNHKLISRWTNANTVEFDDGKTLADKMVGINNETPTYTVANSNTALYSGEKISVAFGKISKAISSLISHLADSVSHITSGERKNWNGKLNASSVSTSLASTSTTTALASSAGKNLQDQITSLNSDLSNKFSLSGGTLNGGLNVGGKIAFWTDNEGGNIDIYSPNGHTWQMDAHNDTTFRIYHHNGSTITGTHSWADHNYQSAGDVTTSSGVSLNGVYNNFANYLPLSGGTVNGNLACNGGLYANGGYVAIGNRLILASNNEGGNIRLASANGYHHWEIDGCNNENLRIYHGTDSHPNYGTVEYDIGFSICMDGNIHSEKKGFVVFRGESVDYSIGTGQLINKTSNFMLSTSSAGHLKTYTYSTGANLDNAITLGTSSARFKQLFAGTANINTSDRNYKDNIKPLSDIHKEFFMKLIPVSFTFKDGESGRTHVGFISQDVESTMTELGMTSLDFAGFCKDKKVESRIVEKITTDEDGNETKIYEEESTPVLDKDGNPEYIYSLRYSEFIGIISHVLQDTVKRLDSLEERLAKLGV